MSTLPAKFRAFWRRLHGTLRTGDAAHDFDAELEAHVAMDAAAGIEAGLSPTEARRQALLRLGGAEQTRQAYRERRGLLWIENFSQDLRYGLRTLRRTPGFTVTAVLTLGLGIGACTAIFSLVNAVLIRSLPYGDPQRLVYLFTPNPNLKIPPEVICPRYGDFYDIKRENKSFADMTSYEQALFKVPIQGATETVEAARVDEGFFSTLQSTPELGRTINADDNQPGHSKVAVISHSLWVSMFGANADVLKRSLQLDNAMYQIIGVMPPKFEYPFNSDLPYGNPHIVSTRIWVPLALTPKQKADRDIDDNVAVARLRPGVSIEQAQSEFGTMMARFNRLYPGQLGDWGALVESFTGLSIGPVRPLMNLLLGTVALVLLIACGNAANLLLARAAERGRELSVRSALGAGRGRMVRQLLTESLLIGIGGCAVGMMLAFIFLRVLPRLDPGNIPRLNEASLDGRVLLVAIVASMLTSMIAGLLPAASASRMQLTDFLKSHNGPGRSAGHSRLQSALIVAQTAMVVVLLAGAGLLMRSYINVISVDTGFSQSTLTMNIALGDRYDQPQSGRAAYLKSILEKISKLPGVISAGAVSDLPLAKSESLSTFRIDGFANQKGQIVEARSITPNYFDAMQIPLIAGRYFSESDDPGPAHPVIINERFARTYFSNRNPIGGRISTDEKQAQWGTVVGVVADVRHTSLEEEPQAQMYSPSYDTRENSLAVRSSLPPAVMVNEIRSALKTTDPDVTFSDVRTMGDLVSLASARRRFQTSLLVAFAAIALVLALVGLYGLMAFSVNRRMREVGIRMALGAERGDVLLLILKNASVLVVSGLFTGLFCTWLITRLLKSFLFGVSEHDPLTVISISVLLVVCGLVAALVPARRAASIDPMQALRTE
ncbi:ABC transporter permease [Telmatobacter sp. DSM 110680]|uniref:ABC transporter permease n=1 Tax=Telmatobacter sp. DSM 110680 TaxID=3036704 RepID=A0AAU7DM01_9BACT